MICSCFWPTFWSSSFNFFYFIGFPHPFRMIRSDQICKLEKPFRIILLSTQFHTLDEKKGIHEFCEGINVEFLDHPLAMFDLLYYLDSQKAINGAPLHSKLASLTLFMTNLPRNSKRWRKNEIVITSLQYIYQVKPLSMRLTWTDNIVHKLFSSKVMKIKQAHFRFYFISRWTISSVFWVL